MLLTALLPAGILNAQDLSLRIETETGRTQFRMGEAIGLKLTFETSPPGIWMVAITGRDRSVLGLGRDRFPVSPAAGTSDPLSYRLGQPVTYSGPGGMYLHERTTIARADLNQWVRFERPGTYRVQALFYATNRRGENAGADSNEIEVEIVEADVRWQAEQLRLDVALLNSAPEKMDSQTFEARMDAARRIWYLDTPDSIRAAARLLGTADVQVSQILLTGLRGSRYRDEAASAMTQLLRSPDQPVTPVFLDTLAALRPSGAAQLRSDLARAIGQKQGSAKAISIKTLLDNLNPETVPAKLRSEISGLFAELPAGQQSDLLNSQWKKIAGPEMIPALRRIYDTAPQTDSPWPPLVWTAVERLYELDPDRTRVLLLEDMSRPSPRLPYRTLAILPDATLPAMDRILLENLEHNLGTEELIGRYATSGILEQVKTFYAKRDAAMRCEPPLVAYFLRVDPAWGERILSETLAERSYPMGRCWMSIVGKTASYYVSPEWEKVAIKALQDPAVAVKTDAVGALGRYGSAASSAAVWESFRYWHDWWKARPAALNEENRRLEQVYLEATAHAGTRVIEDNDPENILENLRDLCITQECGAEAEREIRGRK
jgi:hypothetical protein